MVVINTDNKKLSWLFTQGKLPDMLVSNDPAIRSTMAPPIPPNPARGISLAAESDELPLHYYGSQPTSEKSRQKDDPEQHKKINDVANQHRNVTPLEFPIVACPPLYGGVCDSKVMKSPTPMMRYVSSTGKSNWTRLPWKPLVFRAP